MSRLRRQLKRANSPGASRRSSAKQTWDEMYEELYDYYTEHGDCNVLTRGSKLGGWVSTQRGRKKRGDLTQGQIRDLNRIGFEWVLQEHDGPAEAWIEMFDQLEAYQQEHGDCNIPTETTKLGRWVSTQRGRKKGPTSGHKQLTEDQIRMLDGIGFIWSIMESSPHESWDEMFEHLRQYHSRTGQTWVRKPTTDRERKLMSWTTTQRSRRRKNDLSESQIQQLDSVGFDWNPLDYATITWEEKFAQLEDFFETHGHSKVPTNSPKLGSWVRHQRTLRRRVIKGFRPLTLEQISRLDSLGFVWDAADHDGRWQEMYQELVQYYRDHGHTRVPVRSGKLGKWVQVQRMCKTKKSGSNRQLTQEQIEQLDKIEFIWKADENIETWEAMYEKLRLYKEEHGDCLIPQKQGKLGAWVETQRQRRKRQVTRQKILTSQQVKLLDDLGIPWTGEQRALQIWEQNFCRVQAYYEEHGHSNIPRRKHDDAALKSLSRWVERMRGICKGTLKGQTPLTDEQSKRLKSIGIGTEKKGLPRATESPSLDSPIMNVSETVSQEISVKKEFARSSYAPTRSNATNLNGAWSWLVLPDGRPSIDNGAATQKSANKNKRKQREDTTAANKTAATAKRRWDWIRNLDGTVVTVELKNINQDRAGSTNLEVVGPSISWVKKRPKYETASSE